jgi:glycosyltransferase involved in cell wall biosynthesis
MLDNIKVSVIMSVFNAAEYLREAIDSILIQTYTEFEFIIVNDCSTDNSLYIINSYKDPRIKSINNQKNIGLAASLNKAIRISKGEYIIRMDADDISLNNRIEVQVKFMDNNCSVGVAGTFFRIIGDAPWYTKLFIQKGYLDQYKVRSLLLFGPPVLHPSVIIRKQVLIDNNIFYNEQFRYAQDYELWSRLIFVTKITNIDRVLVKWRLSSSQSSIKNRDSQIKYSKLIHSNILKVLMDKTPTDEQIEIHQWVISQKNLSKDELIIIEKWFNVILNYARSNNFFKEDDLRRECSYIWFYLCMNSNLGLYRVFMYFNSSFGLLKTLTWKSIFVFLKASIAK